MDASEANRRMREGSYLLDVREPSEFEAGHLPGARHISLGRLRYEAATLPKDRLVVVYCGHGERASTAISLLERAGFGNTANLDGGSQAWEAAGLAFER
jgi:hydroxyacylglutathione hydrolase